MNIAMGTIQSIEGLANQTRLRLQNLPTNSKSESETQQERVSDLRTKVGIIYQKVVANTGHTAERTDNIAAALDDAAIYLARIIENPLCSKNWLHIQGSIGTGKTTLAQAVAQVYRIETQCKIKLETADALARYCRIETNNERYESAMKWQSLLLIDDIGTEPGEVLSFGNVITPTAEILYQRYNLRLPTIYTTNLNGADLKAKYGERIIDRMREKAQILTLDGISFRK